MSIHTTEIIILAINYNGSADTIKFIDSIVNLEIDGDFQVTTIIIDNCSSNDDKKKIRNHITEKKNFELLELDDNLGYFPAFNVGLDYIGNKLPTTVLLCNNDLIFEKDFLKLHFEDTYNTNVFVVAPNVITSNGVHQNPHLITKISSFRKFLNELYFSNYVVARILNMISKLISNPRGNYKKSYSKKSQYIYMGIGACYILRPVFFNHIRKLDDRIFLGGEEALLARQLEKAHGETYYNSKLIVHHAEGASFSKMPTKWRYELSKKSYKIYKKYL